MASPDGRRSSGGEDRSTGSLATHMLTTMSRLNRTGVFLGTLVVGLLGMFLPGPWGSLLLYAVVAVLAALLSTTWAVTPVAQRGARLAILALLAAIATVKLVN